jgi:ABC-type siderophore export system fused ATPase/permease subunit
MGYVIEAFGVFLSAFAAKAFLPALSVDFLLVCLVVIATKLSGGNIWKAVLYTLLILGVIELFALVMISIGALSDLS